MRDNAQSWIIWVIVILISISFAFWGVTSYFGGGDEVIVAKINEREISLREYQNEFRRYHLALQERVGGQLPPQFIESDATKEGVLDQMIEKELVQQYLVDAGYDADEQYINREIRAIPEFQLDGKFDYELYKKYVSRLGISQKQFKDNARISLMMEQFTNWFGLSVMVFPYEAENLTRLSIQKRVARTFKIPESVINFAREVSKEETKKEYEKNRENYYTPEAVRLRFVEVKLDKLAGDIEIDESLLKSIYEQQSNRFMTPEKRKMSHILLLTENKDQDEVRNKALTIKQKLDAGEDFTRLAHQFSEDPATASSGGDMGYFESGVLDPELDKALFSMEKDGISEPVKSEHGYHVLKLDEIKKPQGKTFSEAREELLKEEKLRKAQDKFYDVTTEMANLAYEQPDSLEAVAANLKLTEKTTPWIEKNGGGFGVFANPGFVSAAFSDQIIKEGMNSEIVEISPEHKLVLRLEEHRPRRLRSVDEVSKSIVHDILTRRKNTAYEEKAEELIAKLKQGEKPDEFTWSEEKQYERDSNDRLANKIFKTSPDKKFSYLKQGEGVTVIEVVKVINPDISPEITKKYDADLKKTYTEFNRGAFILELKNNAEITKNVQHIINN